MKGRPAKIKKARLAARPEWEKMKDYYTIKRVKRGGRVKTIQATPTQKRQYKEAILGYKSRRTRTYEFKPLRKKKKVAATTTSTEATAVSTTAKKRIIRCKEFDFIDSIIPSKPKPVRRSPRTPVLNHAA